MGNIGTVFRFGGHYLRRYWTRLAAGIIFGILFGLTSASFMLATKEVVNRSPTGAFIVIIYGIVQKYGYDGLAVATIIAGVLLIIMGLARLGTLLRFIPYPLTVGFTSGIAIIIFSSQLNDFLGLHIQSLPADFVEKWFTYAENFTAVNYIALAVGAGSLLIIIFWSRITYRVPGSLVAILLATAAVQFFHIPVETIGSRFGSVPMGLPSPHIPQVTWHTITSLFSPAITIALLGGIGSLLSAVVADGMIRTRHRSNMELIAQGAANIVSPLFLGIPATGAIAGLQRTSKTAGARRLPASYIPWSAVAHHAFFRSMGGAYSDADTRWRSSSSYRTI